MNSIGVSLVDASSGKELQTWATLPGVITHGGEDRVGAIVGAEFSGGCILVERFCDPAPAGNPPILSEETKFDGQKIIVYRTYGEPNLSEIRAGLISAVKTEAGRIILSYCPQYKQANLTARAVEMALTYPGVAGADLPEPHKSEWIAGLAIWEHIKKIRAHSDTLEAEINNIQDALELSAWRPHDWPVP